MLRISVSKTVSNLELNEYMYFGGYVWGYVFVEVASRCVWGERGMVWVRGNLMKGS